MQIFAKTDIGKQRKINEDYFYIPEQNQKIKLFILADGMGGYSAGEVASKMATEAVKEYIFKHFEECKASKEQTEDMIKKAIDNANNVVFEKSMSDSDMTGMGTTIDVCLIYNSKLYIGHIGDSRVYRIRKDFMRKITRDDSYVQTLIEDGTITKEEAFNHPKKNMITKAVGCEKKVEPNVYSKTFIKGDILLMNSDGLTNMIKENEIFELIKKYNDDEENKKDIAEILVEKANENGGLDNITVIVIKN